MKEIVEKILSLKSSSFYFSAFVFEPYTDAQGLPLVPYSEITPGNCKMTSSY